MIHVQKNGEYRYGDEVRFYSRGVYDESSSVQAKFLNEENPFPWMSEIMDLKKEKNFFETRVTEYQSGGSLSWD
jgi:hypothetical protein